MTTMRDFIPISKLGEGTFGSVYKVKRISDDKVYALKKVKMGLLGQKQRENAINQIRILASLDNPNIIGYKQAFYEQNLHVLCIVMEYADEGDLAKLIDTKKRALRNIDEQLIWKALVDILFGLAHLHSKGILHRDLKCANIFISSGVYKLGDLNVSKVNKGKLAYTQTGTPYYASPQVWRDQPYNQKSDIWSLGCIMYEMCWLKPPFMGDSMESLYRAIQSGKYLPVSRIYSVELRQIVDLCLKKDARLRPSAQQLLRHPSIKQRITLNQVTSGSQIDLLKTIQLPAQGLKGLQNKLPKAKYQTQKPKELSRIIEVCQTPKNQTPKQILLPTKKSISQSVKKIEFVTPAKQNPQQSSAKRKSIPRTERCSMENLLKQSNQLRQIPQNNNYLNKRPASNRMEKSSSSKQSKMNNPMLKMRKAASGKYQQITKLLNLFDEGYNRLDVISKLKPSRAPMIPSWWN